MHRQCAARGRARRVLSAQQRSRAEAQRSRAEPAPVRQRRRPTRPPTSRKTHTKDRPTPTRPGLRRDTYAGDMKATHSAVLVLGAVLAVAAGAEPSQSMKYTVLAPISVRPNSEYAVVVTMHDGDKDTTVHLELVSQDPDANRTYSQDVVVPPNSSKTVRMQVGDLGGGNITLSARGGEGDGRWSNSTKLQLATKNASLLIQTDKALYKPGQEVRIRVLALDPRLRPTVHDPLDIHITDGKGNRIKQWAAEHTRNGIWSTVLQLSEQPVMGDWTVTASLPGSSPVNKKFSVAEYVLPTFEVSVKAPAVVSFKHGKVVVTVDAKYTYGKPVVGKATVRAPLPYYWVWEHLQPLPPIDLISGNNASTTTTTTTSTTPAAPRPSHIEKTVPIDGTATVEFDLTEELRLRDSVYWNQVEFEAWAVEELTGRRQNASGSVNTQIRKEDFNIDFVDTPNDFVPGQLFIAKVKVSDLEGAPVQDAENTVLLQTRKSWADNLTTLAEKKVPSNGIVTFEIETKKDAGELNLVATYKESEASHYAHQKRKEQESEEDLYIKVAKESVKVGDDVELVITSKVALQKVTLLVIGPLGLREVQSLGLEGEEGKRKVAARVKVTDGMVPASRVLVHGVKDNGDLITDVTAFKVTGFTPAVEVRVEPGRSQPGHDVTLQVAAKPNATVALLAVDQSVLLLKDASNAITLDELHTERLSYESLTESSWGYSGPGAESLVGGWRGWNDSPEESFKKAGLAYLTNVKIPKRQVTYYLDGLPGGVAFGAPGAAGAIGPLAVSAEAMRPQFAPIASSAAPGGAAPPPRLRTLFPETWLWQELDSGADGNVSLKTVVPDTITSWVVSALAVDPVHGLGLSNTSKLTVFRPFFASLSLPYSVIRGETVEVPVLVFNYMDEPTTATVTMHNPRDEFDFVEPKTSQRGRREAGEGEKTATRTVDVPAQSSAAVSFNITTKKVGNVLLKVTALAKDKAGDALERPLKVKAEGEPQYRNKAIPIDLRKQKEFKTTVKIDMPAMVPDSETVEVSAIGDILGPTTANLDSLIRMPFGCGEQNMLNFVPNIVISKYLKRTRRSTPIIESKARSFSEIGYQKEMTYRHKDGSFSAFGESDKSGSTWLTAFVAKSFELARSAELVQVEPRVVDEALAWLAKQQSDNGSFLEVGTVSHRDMQGGAAKGLALTAYVLTAFLQSQDSTYKHQDTVKKTLEYLVSNLDSLDDPYAVAITTHALHVASHPAKDKAFKLLESKASNEGGYRFWSKAVEADKSNPFWSQPNSVNVEMTSYALMTYISRGLLDEALPIMQWLVSQRNSNGGFASTQDTVVGLQALASMAELISFPLGDMRVQFKYAGSPADDTKGAKEATMVVNSKTSMVFQKEELPRHVREVEVAADGAGFALAQVSWSYNEDTVGKHPLFNLKVHVDKNTATNLLALKVCTSFIGGRWGNESNMAVVEVTLPSGFTADQEALADLKANDKVKRVETKDQDTVIVLYFDKMETKEYCTDVSAVRTHLVSNQKPVPVTVYDYYDQSRRARVFYEAPPVDLIDKQH